MTDDRRPVVRVVDAERDSDAGRQRVAGGEIRVDADAIARADEDLER